MRMSNFQIEAQFQIKLFTREAREAHREMKKVPTMAPYYKGMRDGFLICARSLKGFETQARTTNAILRTVGV